MNHWIIKLWIYFNKMGIMCVQELHSGHNLSRIYISTWWCKLVLQEIKTYCRLSLQIAANLQFHSSPITQNCWRDNGDLQPSERGRSRSYFEQWCQKQKNNTLCFSLITLFILFHEAFIQMIKGLWMDSIENWNYNDCVYQPRRMNPNRRKALE